MKQPSQSPGFIYDAQTVPFTESATLVTMGGTSQEFSLFSVPTEMLSQGETEKPAENSPVATSAPAPINELFTITHEIGAGGYGSVWNGTQNNLKRRVAIKSLKVEVGTDPQFERLARLFKQEALTTAYLQHPSVIPVYDLAEDETGRPIVAMKLVEGRQWNRVLAEDFERQAPLEFLEAHLPVLISVCQAVAYAHSKGIIHRDLKPSQIMIGNYGEVLLMDWGLAMAARDVDGQILCDPAIILDQHSPLIAPLMPAGTPGYMAPEQTLKEANKLGPWTDVYLMGAILYEMLTGYRPHTQTRTKDPFKTAAENVITPPELCTPERDIPAQLSSLAMRSMATRPSDRVPSASAFVAELKDYLVKAGRRGESMALVTEVANSVITDEHDYEHLQQSLDKLDQALAQWPENQMAAYLRHQVLVTFTRIALANHDLKLARLQAERLHECHERKNILKEIAAAETRFANQAQMMERANKQARQERERAETLVRFLLLDLQNELRAAGKPELVYKVATEALQFFDSLHDDEVQPETMHNRCIAYQQIGNVLSEHGRRSEAETAYCRAIELAEHLSRLQPETNTWKPVLADCLEMQGILHFNIGRMEVAQAELERCLEIRKANQTDPETGQRYGLSYAHCLHKLALVAWRYQDYQTALKHLTEAVDLARRQQMSMPGELEPQSDLATFLLALGNVYRDMGHPSEALQVVYEALAIRIALSEQFPGVSGRAEDVFWVRANLGLLQLLSGDLESALENLRHDLSARRRLYEENVSSVARNFGISFQLSVLAEINFLLDKPGETDRLLSECIVHSRRLAKLDESNPMALSSYAMHLVQMGELMASREHWDEASRSAEQAVERARYSYWLSPKNSVVLQPLAQALTLKARLLRRGGHMEQAAVCRSEAEDILAQVKSQRSRGELAALRARLVLDSAAMSELSELMTTLQQERRMDPYLRQWFAERKLV